MVTGVQTCALPISGDPARRAQAQRGAQASHLLAAGCIDSDRGQLAIAGREDQHVADAQVDGATDQAKIGWYGRECAERSRDSL